jgi:hypothetical protein
MSLDLNKLSNKLDEALIKETTETLTKFLNNKRMTNNKQQTAVEQFLNAIKDQILLSKEHLEMIESYADQCKEIEKEKLEDAWVEGFKNWNPSKTFEDYYNETYGGGE